MILTCTCKHEEQDRLNNGKRVFNATAKYQGDKRLYRCTVCNKEKVEK